MDEKQAELEWEARTGRLAGYFAFAGAAFVLGGIVYAVTALPRSKDAKDFLPDLHDKSTAFLGSAVISSIGMLMVIPVLLYLYRATKFRRPQLPPIAKYMAIAGPIVFAVLQVIFIAQQIDAADAFVAGANKANKHAEDLIRNHTSLVAGLSLATRVAVGFAFVLISLNAMRAGLLSRFMGILGMILGALYVLPLVAAPLIQLFWLGALGMLLMNRWPGVGGRGPAWETGEAVEWPSAQRRVAPSTAGRDAPADDEPAPEPAPRSQPNPNARSRKRKRKK
jgi:hypothetical protein